MEGDEQRDEKRQKSEAKKWLRSARCQPLLCTSGLAVSPPPASLDAFCQSPLRLPHCAASAHASLPSGDALLDAILRRSAGTMHVQWARSDSTAHRLMAKPSLPLGMV